ncbi:MAG: hypothetical protein U0900_22820 [Myxococcota bacterium]
MERGDRVEIIRRSARYGFRRWGTATVLEGGTDVVRVQFDDGESFDAYCWSPERARLDAEETTRFNLARPTPN